MDVASLSYWTCFLVLSPNLSEQGGGEPEDSAPRQLEKGRKRDYFSLQKSFVFKVRDEI